MKFLAALETFGKDALADIEIPLTTAHKVYLSAKTLIDQLPADKTVVLGLIDAVETLAADIPVDAAGDGINLAADAKTIKDGIALVTYFRTVFLPAAEQGFEELKAGLAAQPAAAAPVLVQLEPGGAAIFAPAYVPPAASTEPVVGSGEPARAPGVTNVPAPTAVQDGAGSVIYGPGRHNVIEG